MVILFCMDVRLIELLLKVMNIKNGDVKIIKDVGVIVMYFFGGVIRSIIVVIYEFGVEDVFVVGYYGCGMSNLDIKSIVNKMIDRGIDKEIILMLNNVGIDVEGWFYGFELVEDLIRESVRVIKNYLLIFKDIRVYGLIMDLEIGKIDIVINGDEVY